MATPDLETVRRIARVVDAQSVSNEGGAENGFSPSLTWEDFKEMAAITLILAALSLVLGHAILSGEWFLVKAVAFGVIAGMVIGILIAIAKAVIAFTLEYYEEIKTLIVGIPAIFGPAILFLLAAAQGRPLFETAVQAVLMFIFIGAIGQLAFWLLEKFAEHWEGFVLIIIGFLILMSLN